MRILVTGSRVWTREDLVRGAISQYLADVTPEPDWTDIVIIHGACPTGADLHAARWAYDFDVRQETYPANWEMYGKRAGPFRNQQMVDAGADVCLAFPLGASHGTRDCMRRAQQAGIYVKSFEDPAIDGHPIEVDVSTGVLPERVYEKFNQAIGEAVEKSNQRLTEMLGPDSGYRTTYGSEPILPGHTRMTFPARYPDEPAIVETNPPKE